MSVEIGNEESRTRASEPAGRPLENLVRALGGEGARGSDDAPGGGNGGGLADLGPPSTVDRLLRAALVAAVRRGPRAGTEGWGPSRLLEAADRGARAGAVPGSTAFRMRATLESLEEELVERRLWDPGTPLWWHPLPASGRFESIWRELEGRQEEGGSRGASTLLAGLEKAHPALHDPLGSGCAALPAGIPSNLVRRVYRELVAAGETGALDLARGGVGATDSSSDFRTDRVAYRTGFEPELLEAAPTAAVLIQWLLARLPDRLGGDRDLHAPATAMLARYGAPCRGFAPHFDNPGGCVEGGEDNGRAITLVAYLNAPEAPCAGGEVALWRPDARPDDGPAEVLPATGGSTVLFDARRVLHEVRPLAPGPDRWTLVVWLSDAPRPAELAPEPPRPTAAEALEALASCPESDRVPVPRGRVLLPLLEGDGLRVESAEASAGRRPRVGFVCTSHRAGEALERWCRHHLELGADHLLVVLDEVAEPGELEEAHGLAERLSAAPLPGRVTVWSAAEAAGIWPHLAGVQPGYDELVAAAGKGSATDAVAARQTLNATAALQAARAGALGRLQGEPLDWLVHLDSDELFHLEGRSRGGASLTQHFGALDAAAWRVARYANHELLLSAGSGVGGVGGTVRFKLNPRVAAARLGQVGWRRLVEHLGMEQEGPRPYFRAYWNGKSAVAVASGRAAAGVHGWFVEGTGRRSRTAGEGGGRGGILVGPSVLHLHLPTRRAFREKFLAVARSDGNDRERAFPPSPLEERAVGLIRGSLEAGGDAAAAAARLDALHDEADRFEPWQVDLLAEAGLLVSED